MTSSRVANPLISSCSSTGLSLDIILVGFCLISTLPACSVDIPEGAIKCSVSNKESCPTRWHCHPDKGRCYSYPAQESDTDTGLQDSGVPNSDGCIAETTTCYEACGSIFDECGKEIPCAKCSNGEACVDNVCVPNCGGCVIDGKCKSVGDVNPSNPCEVCDPTFSTDSWSGNDGLYCDDGNFCTVSDFCIGTVCRGIPRNCDDGVGCNGLERCSKEEQQCVSGTSACGSLEFCDYATGDCVTSCVACTIKRTCYLNGVRNPTNECQVCDPIQNPDSWVIAIGDNCGSAPSDNGCSKQDTCDSSGNCLPNHRSQGTYCGSGEGECSGQDTCDGRGNCLENNYDTNHLCGTVPAACENQDYCDGDGSCVEGGIKIVGSDCGDSEETECSRKDYCGIDGTCRPNHKSTSTPCGGTPADACTLQDYCDGNGVCEDKGSQPDGASCGDSDQECQIHQCESGACVLKGDAQDGTACGSQLQRTCDDPDTCKDGVCENNYAPSTRLCREAVDPECDIAEYCDGNGSCMSDVIEEYGKLCNEESITDCLTYYCNDGECQSNPINWRDECVPEEPDPDCQSGSYDCSYWGRCECS